MIRGYAVEGGRLREVPEPLASAERVIWFDLLHPETAEEKALERLLGVELPTREEMADIEESSRLYLDQGAAYMTALLPSRVDEEEPLTEPVTFILAGERLVTIRYHEPRSFLTFPLRAEKTELGCVNGEAVLMALLEAIVDRMAEILEKAAREIERISRGVFRQKATAAAKGGYRSVLQDVGRQGDTISNALDSLVSLERLTVFLGPAGALSGGGKESKARIKTVARDIRFLIQHADFLAQKIAFVLEATLGMISIEQNTIIKIFSVAAVAYLPPTLIASIYGMNFDHMPELHWMLGYPFALGLMVASAVVSFWFFKRQGWL